MDIGLIKMPAICGVPLHRESPISTKLLLRSVDVRTNNHFDKGPTFPEVILGSDIVKVPSKLYKSVKVLDKLQCVIETVFSVERDSTVCLYSKIIECHKTTVLIAMNAINTYRGGNDSVIPLSMLTTAKYWNTINRHYHDPFKTIVRPIFSQSAMDDEVLKAIEYVETNLPDTNDVALYKTLYHTAPDVLEALMSGHFTKSPFHNVVFPYPHVNILHQDKWFFKDVSQFVSNVRAGTVHFNTQEFDEIVHRFVSIRPAKMAMTVLILHAIDGILDLGITRHFEDPYLHLFGTSQQLFENIRKDIADILFRSILAYCQIYDIDYTEFGRASGDMSSVTLEKNSYDEVTISFHDTLNDRYVSFYTNYSLICLGTFGVGRLI